MSREGEVAGMEVTCDEFHMTLSHVILLPLEQLASEPRTTHVTMLLFTIEIAPPITLITTVCPVDTVSFTVDHYGYIAHNINNSLVTIIILVFVDAIKLLTQLLSSDIRQTALMLHVQHQTVYMTLMIYVSALPTQYRVRNGSIMN